MLLSDAVDCNCTITQAGVSYAVTSLLNDETPVEFYSYGNPNFSSANTGLEIADALIIFLYQDTTTGIISLFLIADEAQSGDGGELTFEFNCVTEGAYVSVADEEGEFSGEPPLITGDWVWTACCTDGGVIEDIGCSTVMNLDLLISTGIDSIVWLTGDINDPDQILLALTGEAITIDCGGGGVCCPVDLDTEANITDATCPDTPDGGVVVYPQDGSPNYTYDWSNGGNSAQITNLLPGTYTVTITDIDGCMEILDVTVDVDPGVPPASPASLSVCSETASGTFDLSTLESTINEGSGDGVLWYEDMSLLSPIITTITNYTTTSTTIYAVVDNGFCLSEPVPVTLEVIVQPTATATSIEECDETNGMATFDLVSIANIVSGGTGTILWFTDMGLTAPINNPGNFVTGTTTIYAVVSDEMCDSEPVEIQLTVNDLPLGISQEVHLCGNELNEAEFDLVQLEPDIGSGDIEWYFDMALSIPVFDPSMFSTVSTTVYAQIFDGQCYSEPIPVMLVVDETPVGVPAVISQCDIGTGTAIFNLFDYEMEVTGGTGFANWFTDVNLSDQIPDPGNFESGSTTIYAVVDNDLCLSEPVPVTLELVAVPSAVPATLETCADSNGLATFNLLNANDLVSLGLGDTVIWYEDDQGNMEIAMPEAYLTSGATVYAQVSDGECLSELVPVDLFITNSVSATPSELEGCDEGDGTATFDLTGIQANVSGGSGTVNWFNDPNGTTPISTPGSFNSPDTTIYASVTAGECISDIVPITLLVVPQPVVTPLEVSFCGDSNAEVTLDLSDLADDVADNGSVAWFSDAGGTNPISNPGSLTTGDTVIFAVASLGNCTTATVPVTIQVSGNLALNPVEFQFCILVGDTIFTNLTDSNSVISATGTIMWFTDPQGTSPISTPGSFPVSADLSIVYVQVVDGNCESLVTAIPITVYELPDPVPINIDRCGDMGNFVTVDLTQLEMDLSDGLGQVNWYGNSMLTQQIPDPSIFVTGDTLVFAVVSNGPCSTSAIPLSISVVNDLSANSIQITECALTSDSMTLDLLSYGGMISPGANLLWFFDASANDTITDPETFTTGSVTIYAQAVEAGCTSEIVPVDITIIEITPPAMQCGFSSTDSLAIDWLATGITYTVQYMINGGMTQGPFNSANNTFSVAGLQQNDSVEFILTVSYNTACNITLSDTVICVTESCPDVQVEFIDLAESYCTNNSEILLNASPAGGTFSGVLVTGDTLLPGPGGTSTSITYQWTDSGSDCDYSVTQDVNFVDPPMTPEANCLESTFSSVTFEIIGGTTPFSYFFSVNQGAPGNIITSSESQLLLDGLAEGDEVSLTLWSQGTSPCANSDSIVVSCSARECPGGQVDIDPPGSFCSDDPQVQLTYTLTGLPADADIEWTGNGVSTSGVLDPASIAPGTTQLILTLTDSGCVYRDTAIAEVRAAPTAEFTAEQVECLNIPLQIIYTGSSSDSAALDWTFDGGMIISGDPESQFEVEWSSAGVYSLSLVVEDQGCISDTTLMTVQIDSPLMAPDPVCADNSFNEITISWEPVEGAQSYTATTDIGFGSLDGTRFIVTGIPDNTSINVQVTANSNGPCPAQTAMIACETEPKIPAELFLPNVFSPNADGINDIFFPISNDEVDLINSFRIFDRWGTLLYEAEGFEPNLAEYGWNGEYRGKSMTPGVFVYTIEATDSRGETIILKGDVTLIR